MAIAAECPHCKKGYKFKDEMAGKRVKCAGAACRQVFEVVPQPKVDAEALALAALADNPDPVALAPADTRKVRVTCVACDHVWEEPWDKQGKNVLCPECRHRQKVPEQKGAGQKVDWRDPKKDRPTLAKVEEVPEDVWGSSKSNVSIDTLKKAGAIPEPEAEPRPMSYWLKIGTGITASVGLAFFGIWYFVYHGKDAGEMDKLMKEAVAAGAGLKDAGLTPASAAAGDGVLRVADAEFLARMTTADRRKLAIDQFQSVRNSLDGAPKGMERDAALTEWLVAVCALGGDEQQVKAGTRIGWEPAGNQARAQINGKVYLVIEELQAGFAALQKSAEFDTRLSAFRRLTATLAGYKQTKLLQALLGPGFVPDELAEVQGYLGLDLFRLGEELAARDLAAELHGSYTNDDERKKAKGSVRALWHVTQLLPLGTIPPGSVEMQTRTALALAKAMEKNGDGVAAEVNRPSASPSEQFRVFGWCAESMDDPGVVVARAAELFKTVQNNKDEIGRVGPAGWARLARAAARAGKDEAAGWFAAAPLAEEGRAHALAEMVRGKLAAIGSQKADPAWVDLPDDPKKLHVGHLIARLNIVRHNGKVTGDAGLVKSFGDWPKETVRPFGLAGLALGLQDKYGQ